MASSRRGPVRPLAGVGHLVRAFRNLVDVWPADVFEAPVVEGRLLGKPITYVVDPECIRILLMDEAHKLVRDEAMTRSLAPILGTGLLTSDGETWRAQRRTTAPSFRPEHVRSFVPAMSRAAEATRRRWQEHGGRSVIDLQSEMMQTALEVVTTTIVSGEEGFDSVRFGQALDTYLGQTNWKIAYGVAGVPDWLPHPHSFAGARAAHTLRAMTSQVIERRRRSGVIGDDLLGMMLTATDPETGDMFSDERLIDNLLTFVMAGHETTALAMAWAFRLLADHPAVERRVLDEIASLPAPIDAPDTVDRLVYTRQVVLEAMRLFPPAALMVRRATEALRVGDVCIPAGRSVHIPIYALHRHRRLWSNPDEFDPDRFDPELHKLRHRFAFLPFGGGRRVCIGMGLAMTECLVVLATLLPHVHFRPLTPALPRTHLRVTLRPVGGLPVAVMAREGA
ncbi:MAG: cytochrome P450 [Janthinobacterium lividum]